MDFENTYILVVQNTDVFNIFCRNVFGYGYLGQQPNNLLTKKVIQSNFVNQPSPLTVKTNS